MVKLNKRALLGAGFFLAAFLLLTVLVLTVDVASCGASGAEVGLSGLNGAIFSALGENDFWYTVTEVLGALALGIMAAFAVMGGWQLIARRSLRRVDGDILAMGVCYVLMMGLYVLFELVVINCRPILVDGLLEASFPSSHTMLVVTVVGSAAVWTGRRFRGGRRAAEWTAALLICAVTVVGRLLSGMHWFTDILAGLLLGCALAMGYAALAGKIEQ